MNTDIYDLYQEIIIDHSKQPCNFREIKDTTHKAEGFNHLCGDHLILYVKLVDGVIEDIAFQGSGCAISKASASLMTVALKGKKQEDIQEFLQYIHTLLTEGLSDKLKADELGNLAALAGVYKFPMRVKCATLALHTLCKALGLVKK